MIKYNSNTINDWNFGDDNIIKVYRNNAVCYYKITGGGDTPTAQTPCFAVVDDISQYSDTEFEDVYDNATEKWYKLNNLNQYEEYGIYGSGRTITTYEGKLTIDEETSSRLPQGYTEVEYIENPNLAYIDSGFKPNQDTRILFTFKFEKSQSASMLIGAGGWDRSNGMVFDYEQNLSGTLHISWGGTTVWDVVSSVHGDYNVHTYDWNKNEFYIDDTLVSSTTYRTFQCSDNLGIFSPIQYPYSPFGQQHFACGRLYDFKIYDNGTLVRDLVPCINPSNSAGMYDIVNDVFYTSAYNGYNFIGGEPVIQPTKTYEYMYSGGSWVNVGEVSGSTASYKYWMWRSTGDIVGRPSNFIQFSEFDLSVDGSDVSLTYISASPTGVTNETADNLFDNSTNTKYCADFSSYITTNYVLFESQSSITPTSFAMTTANDSASTGRYPKNWVLLGSHTSTTNWDDGSWDVVLSGTCGNEMKANYKRVNYPIEGLSGSTYPKYYDEMQDPPNNLTFSSMAEAEAYECPWVGMNATIDGDKYVFSGDSQSGYEWIYNPSRLPQGYTEVEYIENQTSAYIDTNFKPNQDTRIVAEMQTVTSTSYGRFIGAGSYEKINAMQFDYETGAQGILHISWGAKSVGWISYSNCVGDYNRHIYDWDKNYFYRDKGETNEFSASTTYTSFQCTNNLGIFCNINNGAENNLLGRMYSFQIYDNGTLIRDLVPCVRDNDNTVGAYDIVNDVFYTVPTGYTTDKLVAGPTV